MPRYYFHIEGEFPFHDETGTEFRDDRSAWQEALLMTRDIETTLEPGERWVLTVKAGNRLVYKISISSEEGDGPHSRPLAPAGKP
jgi:uncharacterized protein DUF6894